MRNFHYFHAPGSELLSDRKLTRAMQIAAPIRGLAMSLMHTACGSRLRSGVLAEGGFYAWTSCTMS